MKKVTTDVAIRKNYFEDTIVILGDFNVAGHDMNYVLRVSSYGSKVNGQNVRVYFGLLDDTKREYSEYKQEYPGEKVIIDDAHLLVRTDMIEINDSPEGLKLYINYETIAVGDSYNDLEMLNASKKGFLFHASDKMKAENPNLIPIDDFDSLYEAIMQSL